RSEIRRYKCKWGVLSLYLFWKASMPCFNNQPEKSDDEDGPFISGVGLIRHASLNTGMAVIQPVLLFICKYTISMFATSASFFFFFFLLFLSQHEMSTLLGMRVLREEIEKLARLLKIAQQENQVRNGYQKKKKKKSKIFVLRLQYKPISEYQQKNIQLEREVEELQTKLRQSHEKVDKLERVFSTFNDSLSERKENEEDMSPFIGSSSCESVLIHSPSHSISIPVIQPNDKMEKLALELQKENMKLQYMKEMYEDKIHDLTQVLFVLFFFCLFASILSSYVL
ncbi:hypothetical protein RFI_16580, partial [Reticulomyxa filosa]